MSNGGRTSYSILLVDDDLEILELFKESLENLSFMVHASGNGEEALLFLEKNKVDCIITDISMPNITGPELIRELRDKLDLTPFFFITGYHEYPREELNRYKPEAIIFKPFDFEETSLLIKNCLIKILPR